VLGGSHSCPAAWIRQLLALGALPRPELDEEILMLRLTALMAQERAAELRYILLVLREG
jgi:hypothetical protein